MATVHVLTTKMIRIPGFNRFIGYSGKSESTWRLNVCRHTNNGALQVLIGKASVANYIIRRKNNKRKAPPAERLLTEWIALQEEAIAGQPNIADFWRALLDCRPDTFYILPGIALR
jgi:hypothetical protein